MNTTKIKKHNGSEFIDELKSCKAFYVYASDSDYFLQTTKAQVIKMAECKKVDYHIQNVTTYIVKRNMIIT